MNPINISNMFHTFSYLKSSEEIISKSVQKVTDVHKKIEERRIRIKALRTEYKITDAVYIDLLEQARDAMKRNDNRMSYSVSNAIHDKRSSAGGLQESDTITVGAGVVNNLLTESDHIKSEEAQVKKLQLIIRNLKDEEREWSDGRKIGYHLGESELEYLNF